MEDYGLDPASYYTLPNFAFDAMLKMNGVEIDLIFRKGPCERWVLAHT